MVAGQAGKSHRQVRQRAASGSRRRDLQANLERIAAAFPDKIVEREAVKEAKSIDDIISAPGTIKEGGAYINDKGVVCEKIEARR